MKTLGFGPAMRSFIGYLEGTGKSHHTIKNYRLDLLAFQDFFEHHLGRKSKPLHQLVARDLERYHQFMKSQGLKNNTRRRKLMTLRKFLSYLAGRKKLPTGMEALGKTLLTPYKLERIPVTVPAPDLAKAIRQLPASTELDLRNRALLRTLLETGCLISEAAKLRWEDGSPGSSEGAGGATLEFRGKNPRRVAVSRELYDWVMKLRALARSRSAGRDAGWIFQGFNKFGSMGGAISPRGIEILVKSYAPRLGFLDLVPRTFRHSAILDWLRAGVTEQDIQRRLGLRSAYAFRAYRVQSSAEARAK